MLASLVLFVVALLARGSVLGVLLGLYPSHALVELLLQRRVERVLTKAHEVLREVVQQEHDSGRVPKELLERFL